ncbi:hypothetical protein EWH99_05020 [Sporolactobacillus sp. THM7-7]|nr:hypothetical protein EWH99_05020 [Sporolactobacillus sp. THM7-7]
MLDISIAPVLKSHVPNFKAGVICYHHIVIGELPQIIAERLPLFYENIRLTLEEVPVSSIEGVKEWRSVFKKAGTDPSRYRPSQEALLRRIKKNGRPPSVHSAVDLNNFFSVQYGIPLGIYDLDRLHEPIQVTIGTAKDQYDGLNGRTMHMENKIVSVDRDGAFGSPIVDSRRTCVTMKTVSTIQIIYLRPSMNREEAGQLVKKMADMFTQAHGGENEWTVIE